MALYISLLLLRLESSKMQLVPLAESIGKYARKCCVVIYTSDSLCVAATDTWELADFEVSGAARLHALRHTIFPGHMKCTHGA